MDSFLIGVIKQFKYYQSLGDKTITQLSNEQLFWQYNEESNSIAILVKHMHGNMLSRWTDFLTSDGEKEWRKRDEEFHNDLKDKTDLLEKWTKGWKCLFDAVEPLSTSDLEKTIYIRNMGQTVVDAINRQLAHYAYHTGQIVFLGKMIQNEKWTSLSIPKGESNIFNQEKMSKPKRNEHFTDNL